MPSSQPVKAPTIKDVAQVAGVSFKTVSRVLNNHPSVNPKMRQAVEEAIKALAYRPHQAARTLRSQRSHAIALLTGWSFQLMTEAGPPDSGQPYTSEFLNELTLGCGFGAQECGYHLIYEITYGDRAKIEESVVGLIRNLRPDGIILMPPLCDVPWFLDLLDEHGVRYARLLAGTELHRGMSFVIDDFDAAKNLTQLLLDAGHRHLGMIAGPSQHVAANERRKAFEAAAAERPGTQTIVKQGDFTVSSGRVQALELLQSPHPPTAIFAANDAMAAGAMSAASELGIAVPAQLSLVGFDDTIIASMLSPPLTTVKQPTFEMARLATTKLAQAADAGLAAEGELTRLDYVISERASIAPPPS